MPKSKVRKATQEKKTRERQATQQAETVVQADRSWVPYVFIPLGLLGVLWLVVYYIAGRDISFMANLGDWNMLIGIGLMASAFIVATFWK